MAELTAREKTAFFDACDSGDLPVVIDTLTRHPEALRLQKDGGWTPLLHAVGYAQTEVIAFLLECGADAEEATPAGYTGSTLAQHLNYESISDMFRAAAATREQREEQAAHDAAVGQFTKGLEKPLAVQAKPLKLKK